MSEPIVVEWLGSLFTPPQGTLGAVLRTSPSVIVGERGDEAIQWPADELGLRKPFITRPGVFLDLNPMPIGYLAHRAMYEWARDAIAGLLTELRSLRPIRDTAVLKTRH